MDQYLARFSLEGKRQIFEPLWNKLLLAKTMDEIQDVVTKNFVGDLLKHAFSRYFMIKDLEKHRESIIEYAIQEFSECKDPFKDYDLQQSIVLWTL